MQVTLTGAVINIVLNYLLIFGKLGFPQLGVEGAGYATLLCRVYMSIAAIILFFRMDLFKPDRKNWKLTRFDLIKSMHLLRIGVPIGSQYITEMLAFSIGSFMMGWIGTNALAAHQVVMSLVGFTYMVSAGLASATTIKVSHFRGQRNLKEMNRAIYASIHMVGLFMFCSLLIFYNFRFFIPSLFIQDPAVIAIASKLMIIAAMFQLFDGFQVNMLGALRGMEDVRIPMILLAIAYFAIALPFSYLAGIALKFGPQGVWFGYLFGLFSVSVQLFIRYKYKAKRLKV
jgi:MATE family multidrug resistance protein